LYSELIRLAYDNGHLIYITTLTWLFRIDVEEICLMNLLEHFDVDNVIIETKNNSDEEFMNQITLKFTTISSKSIKIFKNGHVQITGLSSYFECMNVSSLVLEWMNKFIPRNDHDDCTQIYKMKKNSQRIAMINLSVSTFPKHLLILKNLSSLIQQNKEVTRCTYNPENHRGLNIKFSSGVSMFIFHTGNIIMSSNSMADLKKEYLSVQKHFVQKNTNIHTHRSLQPIRKRQIEHTCHGYDMKDLMACLVLSDSQDMI
jgi:TATA-box binding protein (TBP) (component of TFIID and TFIIIB)